MKIAFKCSNFKVANFNSLVLCLVLFCKFWIFVLDQHYTLMMFFVIYVIMLWLALTYTHDVLKLSQMKHIKLEGIKKNDKKLQVLFKIVLF